MKKFLSLLIALSLVFVIFAFSACGGGNDGDDDGGNGEQTNGETTGSGAPTPELPPDEEPEEEEFDLPAGNNESTNLDNIIKW